MFQNAALKLSLYYLAIIMALSVGFSFFLYHISSNEVSRSLGRPEFVTFDIEPAPDYNQFRSERLLEAQESLRANLIAFNIFILVAGGIISYALARQTLEPIEEAMEAQSRFTADASHELRTPLTAMQTEIEVALRNKQLSKDQAVALLGSNLEEVIKLRSLSDALLKLARNGQTALEIGPQPLVDVVANSVDHVDAAAKTKKITIKNELQAMDVAADKDALGEIITVLLDNAIKYCPKGSEISLSSLKHGHEAQLAIKDNGPGIAAKDLPHIFERFYRSDSSRTKNDADGYGLGLSIAAALAELQHGRVSVKSEVGKGSTFTVHLPLCETAADLPKS